SLLTEMSQWPDTHHLVLSDSIHPVIPQAACWITNSKKPQVAQRYLDFLHSCQGQQIMSDYGYRID
ncbi:MAG: substrate-binding domain-containing protein, partial [Bacteroidota bacterium]